MELKMNGGHLMPQLGMVGTLDTDKGADMAKLDGLNGYVDMLCLYLNGSDDTAEWRRAFAQFVTGLYEGDRLDTPDLTPEQMADQLIAEGVYRPEQRERAVTLFARSAPAPTMPAPLHDGGAACQAAGAFLRGLERMTP